MSCLIGRWQNCGVNDMEMRKVLFEELKKAMEENDRVCLLAADLSKAMGIAPLLNQFPERAFNVGIAEANMTSVAAGRASCAMIPVISSFAPFVSRRNCDQLMISVAYAKQNVKIIGSDPGINAETNGGTHMPFEDIGVLRSIPTIVIVEVADPEQLRQAVPAMIRHNGPVYLRMARKEQPAVFDSSYHFDLFKADLLREGSDVTILATGLLLSRALEAAELLENEGIRAEVINVHTIKPLDQETILASVKKTGCVVTAENHNVIGGLYSAVSELLAANQPAPIERVGIEDEFGEVGNLAALSKRYHLNAEDIVNKAKFAVGTKEKE